MAYVFSKAGEPITIPSLIEGLGSEGTLANKQEAWANRSVSIKANIESVLGPFPEQIEPSFSITDELEREGIVVQRIQYSSWDNDIVPALVMFHPDTRKKDTRAPGIMALHQTAPQGKDEVAGLSPRIGMNYGLELAQRGFIVLAPDVLSAGERIFEGHEAYRTAPFQERYPEWSMMGKMIYDHRLGLTVLQSLPNVDPARIGAIGHSLGGYNAFMLAAFDSRIQAAVSSCGFSTFAGDSNPERWGLRDWFSHMPQVNAYLERGEAPFEFHEAAALVAPRALFNWSTQQDHIFPHWQAIAEGALRIGELYQYLEADSEQFVSLVGIGGHGFPDTARFAAFSWLERQLKT